MRYVKLTNKEHKELMFYLHKVLKTNENEEVRNILTNKILGCKWKSR